MDYFLELTAAMSVGAGMLTYYLIPRFKDMFIKANLYGVDLNKASGDKVPEATGVITGKFVTSPYVFEK
jgi:UDP-N-acetylglucosamine--dolichyl-phosphate N-acetylglucosaminephosphotransferase